MRDELTPTDRGFGLVEVIVAIFILGLLAVAVLPMIVTGLSLSAQQGSVATATRLVSETIDEARADPSLTCDQRNIARTATDGRGNTLQIVGQVLPNSPAAPGPAPSPTATTPVNPCTSFTAPGTILYRVQVSGTVSGASRVLAEATTRIFIPDPGKDTP